MAKKKNWEAFVLKDTNIPWTEIWDSSDVEVESVKLIDQGETTAVFNFTNMLSSEAKGTWQNKQRFGQRYDIRAE